MLVMAAAIPLAVAATAYACANLATLKLNRGATNAGEQVTAYGRSFNSNAAASAVTLRFNGRNGRVLWQGRPATNGRITGTFAVPQAAPGYYVIVATQTGPDGRPAGGTPGRAPLKIKGASASSRRSSGTAPWIAPGPGGSGASGSGPDGLPAAPLLVGLTTLMLGLAGGGVALVRRRPLDAPRPLS